MPASPSASSTPRRGRRLGWIVRLAWRDARASRRSLLLHASSVVLGVAALVALGSFRDNLREAVERESKSLLGADLAFVARRAFTAEAESLIASLGGRQARETEFTTIAQFPANEGSRLVQVRALAGPYPFYGALATEPAQARVEWERAGGALVDAGLLLQFDQRPGGRIRLGAGEFIVRGGLRKSPGESAVAGAFAPRVYIREEDLPSTQLLGSASLARHRRFVQLPSGVDAEAALQALRPALGRLGIDAETAAARRDNLAGAMDRVFSFLNLAGVAALLLGALGVAGALRLHLQPKLAAAATLRCLGATPTECTLVFSLQAGAVGAGGSLAGAALGWAAQQALPALASPFLPAVPEPTLSPAALFSGLAVGILAALAAALGPLLRIRKVTPLGAVRAAVEESSRPWRDPARWALSAAVAAAVVAALRLQAGNWALTASYAGALLLVFGLLAGAARGLLALLRLGQVSFGSLVLRQGLQGLHRPGNRSVVMVVALGACLFLILSLTLGRSMLLREIEASGSGGRPNLIAWDIQSDQSSAVLDLAKASGLDPQGTYPVVTMRLTHIRGRSVDALLADRSARIPAWRLKREYRSTFREALVDTERIVAGVWAARHDTAAGEPVPVSIEKSFAEECGLQLGDRLDWEVQGVPLSSRVGSIREVDWRRFSPNFFAVFPGGVLEDAPRFELLSARAPDASASAAFQRQLGRTFPGVAVIDLRELLRTVDALLDQAGQGIQFLAAFTLLTGAIVLAGAILGGKFQREREAALLRALGADRAWVRGVQRVEFLVLGGLAAIVGGGLAWGAAWALGHWVWRTRGLPPWEVVAWGALGAVLVGWALGSLSTRSSLRRPPLEVLRAEP